MPRFNRSSWFPMSMYDRSAPDGLLFGPALQAEQSNCPYPKEKIKLHETVIWSTVHHKTVSLKSYERAHREHDDVALEKIRSLGIPLNCTFGGILAFT